MTRASCLFCLLFLSCFAFNCNAQLFTYGPKAGVSLSALNTSGNPPYAASGSKVGFNLGFFIIKEFSHSIYLHVEPTYSAGLGGNIKYRDFSNEIEEIKTLTLPVIVGKRISNFRLFVGLAPGKGTSTVAVDDFLRVNASYSEADGGGDIFVDYVAGAGLDVRNLMFNIRYSNAMTGGFFYDGYSDNFIRLSQIVLSAGVKLNKK